MLGLRPEHTQKILREAGKVAQTTQLIYDQQTKSMKVMGPPRRIPTKTEGVGNLRAGTWYLHATCDNKAMGRVQMTVVLAFTHFKKGWVHFDSAYSDETPIPVIHAGYYPLLQQGFFGEQILLDFSVEQLKEFSGMKTIEIKVANGPLKSSDRVFGFSVSGAYFLGFLRALEREGIDRVPQQISNTRQGEE